MNFLKSDLVWMCVSCETCFARCPMKIDMAAIMDALRNIAVHKKIRRYTMGMSLFLTNPSLILSGYVRKNL